MSKESFEVFLERRITDLDCVDVGKVNVAYIEEQRARHFYPTTRYNIYGGSTEGVGLAHFTRNELEELDVTRILSGILT